MRDTIAQAIAATNRARVNWLTTGLREGSGPRQRKPLGRTVVLTNFDEAGWSKIYSAGSIATQQGDHYRHGASSLKLTSDAGTSVTAELTFGSPLDLSNHNFVADFYIEDVSKLDTTTPLTIEFYTDSVNPTKRWTWRPTFSRLKTGWNRLAFARGAGMGSAGSPVAGDWADTWKMRVYPQAAASQVAVVHFDALHATVNPRTKGLIVVSTDDGFATDFTIVRPKLDQYGMRGSFNIAGSLVGTASYLTTAQMQMLDDAGHCLCDHTYDHTDVTGYGGVEQTVARLRQNQQFLYDYTSGRGMRHLVYPGGYYSDTTRQAAAQLYASARITEAPGQIHTVEPVSDLLTVSGYGATTARVLSDYTTQFAAVETYKTALIWYCHQIVAAGPTGNQILQTTFESCIDDIAARNIEVVTMDEFYNCLSLV